MDGVGGGGEDPPLPSSSSSPPPSFRFQWDVFLSFRGEDTRHGFTERLYNELIRNGVRTFRDDDELDRGEEIAPSLLEAIQDSAAVIAVISPNYASSRWCLEELAAIVDCRRLLLPVFFQVDPSDVRRQKGPFEEHFRSFVMRFGEDRVSRWRKAMEKAGGISGWDSRIWDEQLLIQSLIKKILTKLNNTPLGVAKFPVGLDSRSEELMTRLDIKTSGADIIGIHGMGGVGKTTLAKVLYNKLVIYFKHRSFIPDVRETWKQDNGATSLQHKLIGDLSSSSVSSVTAISEGLNKIKELLYNEPVLVVLDDVDDVQQLNVLVGERDLIFQGSRIIITTRDKEVIEGTVNEIYEVKELSPPHALQLFSYHAFGRDKPAKDFLYLSSEIVSLAGGLPLALEVFGSLLSDKRRIKDWESALQKLKRIRPGDLQDVLEISFNELDIQEQCIFLDIACFFVQMNIKREDAIDIFNGCGFSAEIAVTVLTAKSLVRIIDDNILWMHDQLRDMGRQIVQRENLEDPGRRSRLWEPDEIMTVLNNDKGTQNIRGIVLDFGKKNLASTDMYNVKFVTNPGLTTVVTYLKELCKKSFGYGMGKREENLKLHAKSFKPLIGLRLLQINWVILDRTFESMPAGLKWLQWKGCPYKALPKLCPQDLAVLDLSESRIRQVWENGWWDLYRNKIAQKLLVMDLTNCCNLESIPDLSSHQILEKLILKNCKGLTKIHKSVGDLSSLLLLNLQDCSNLVELPKDISGLKRLKHLILSGCSRLQELPENMGNMKSLTELLADYTDLSYIPDSIFRLKKLEKMSLKNCNSLKFLPGCIGKLASLRELSLSASALEELPSSIGMLTSLETVDLMRCKSLTAIPDSICSVNSLIELFLNHSSIEELPASIGSLSHLKSLSVSYCLSLSKLPDSVGGLASMVNFWLEGAPITELPDQICSLKMLEKLEMGNCELLTSLPESTGNMLNMTKLVLDNVKVLELPESICMMERLEMLKLNRCWQLQKLPTSIGNLKSLRYLLMEQTGITVLPEQFGQLSSLQILKMSKQQLSEQSQNTRGRHEMVNETEDLNRISVVLPKSFSHLSSLKELNIRAWKMSGKIPDHFEKLSSLQILNLGHNNFCSLPSCLRGLSILRELVLDNCKKLKSLPVLPSSLVNLNAANCSALESINDLSNLENLWELHLTNCKNIMDIPGLQYLKSLRRLYLSGCIACFPAVKRRLSKAALKYLQYLCVPASDIPNWFVQEIPCFSRPKNIEIKGMVIGVVISLDPGKWNSFRDKLPAIVDVQAKILKLNESFTHTLSLYGIPETDDDQLYLCRFREYDKLLLMLKDGDRIELGLRSRPYFQGLTLKKCGIHLVFENDDDDDIDDDDEESLSELHQSLSKKLAKFFFSL